MHAGRIGEIRKRLTKDGQWRLLFNKDILEEDVLLPDHYQLDKFREMNKDLQQRQGDYHLGQNRQQIVPFVYRISKPNLPNQDDVVYAIGNGDDNQHNTLIVDLEGNIKLEEFTGPDNFAPRAVRLESFVAGNGYVGREAANDRSLINRSYEMLLDGWVTHLKTGRLDIFQDYSTNSINKSLEEIAYLTKNLGVKA